MKVLSGPSRQEYFLFSPATCDDETPRQEEEQITTTVKAAKLTPQTQQYLQESQEKMPMLPTIEEDEEAVYPDAVQRRGAKRPATRTAKKTNKYKYISLAECSLHIHELVNIYAVRYVLC
jgi:hypothetical protein